MITNADAQTPNNTMPKRTSSIGMLLRVAPSTPGKEQRRGVVTCEYLDDLSIKIESDIVKRETEMSTSVSLPRSIAFLIPNSPNECEEGIHRFNRKQSMKRNNEYVERWSDSISVIRAVPRKHDSMPSFPCRSEKDDTSSSPRQIKPICKAVNNKAASCIATDREHSSQRPQCNFYHKTGPPVEIDCIDRLKGLLDNEDLTDFSLDHDDEFSDTSL